MILTCVRCGVDYSGYPYSNLCPDCESDEREEMGIEKEPDAEGVR